MPSPRCSLGSESDYATATRKVDDFKLGAVKPGLELGLEEEATTGSGDPSMRN
jgi:hypothetical protein